MQQDHKTRTDALRKPLNYRLPEGFSGLRNDVGHYLCEVRQQSEEYGAMSPKQFAAVLEIRRETLSRIDHDRQWPAFRTLFRYLDLLGLELDEVANKDGRPRAPIPDYPDVCWELGQALDAGRKQERLTLRDLSEHTGISYSQLSRLTRGQFKGGRNVEVSYVDGQREFDADTLVWFTHPVLDYLSELGGFLRDIGKRAF